MIFVVRVINYLIYLMGEMLGTLFNLLPNSPFNFFIGLDIYWVKVICWIFPFYEAVAHLQVYLLAVGIYYGVRYLSRWIRFIGA